MAGEINLRKDEIKIVYNKKDGSVKFTVTNPEVNSRTSIMILSQSNTDIEIVSQ